MLHEEVLRLSPCDALLMAQFICTNGAHWIVSLKKDWYSVLKHTRTWGAQDWVNSKTWLVRGQNENSVPTAVGLAVEVLSIWRWRNYCYLTEYRLERQRSGSTEQPLQTSFALPERLRRYGLVIVVLLFNSVFYLFFHPHRKINKNPNSCRTPTSLQVCLHLAGVLAAARP